jgi:hypothetical protein
MVHLVPGGHAGRQGGLACERLTETCSYLFTCSFSAGGDRRSSEWKRVNVVGRGKAVFGEVYVLVRGSKGG